MDPGLCLIDGEILPESEARVSVHDRGFLYADGVFETLRVYRGRPFLVKEHWARLADSARFLDLPVPGANLEEWIGRLVEATGLRDSAARLTLTRGSNPRGPRPSAESPGTVVVQVRRLPPDLERRAEEGVELRRAPWPLRARGLPFQEHKTLAYLPSVLALGAVNASEEAVLWNTHGHLCEGATSNLFWVAGGRLYTPHPEAGCLRGIARATVLNLAVELGLGLAEGHFGPEALARADEAFITNSVVEVLPATRFDGNLLGSGSAGPVTRSLQTAYRKRVEDAFA